MLVSSYLSHFEFPSIGKNLYFVRCKGTSNNFSNFTNSMDDGKLKDLLNNNPRLAVAEILKKYGGAILGVLFKMTGSKEEAEDLLQDTSVKIWKNADKYDDSKGRLFTWILNIARNTAIDKTRTKKFQENKKSQQLDSTVYDNIRFSEEMKILDPGLENLINQLDPKYRQIIDLLYLQGYSQKEIATQLDIPLGTVKSRGRSGIKQLRKLMKKQK